MEVGTYGATTLSRVNFAGYVGRVTIGADSIGHGGTCPHFYKWLGTRGTVCRKTANQAVLTITKALTKTHNCTCGAKKVKGHEKKFFRHDVCPFPTFKFVPAPMRVTTFSWIVTITCCLVVGLGLALDLVSGCAHVFVLLSIFIATLPFVKDDAAF